MQICDSINQIAEITHSFLRKGKSIGLVPTMGALHEGHMTLVDRAKKENDISVITIFVNPIQFNSHHDLVNYPRDIEKDLNMLQKAKADYVFTPKTFDMYPQKPRVTIEFGEAGNVLEGKYRPDHFKGVGILVLKLLNIIKPSSAYFGLKDIQQFLLIQQMCYDFNCHTKIVGVETQREANGLAFSSRNKLLSREGIAIATNISHGLYQTKNLVEKKHDIKKIKKKIKMFYAQVEGLNVEYFDVFCPLTFKKISDYEGHKEMIVCISAYVENVRLIDNLYLHL